MKVKHVPIFVLVGLLAIMSGMPLLLSGGSSTNYAFARYATDTQTQANSNECNTGTNCAITSPQTQGDGTANSPTNLQVSRFNEDGDEEGDGGTTMPPTHTCVECFTESLTPEQISRLQDFYLEKIFDICQYWVDNPQIIKIDLDYLRENMSTIVGVDQTTVNRIIDCIERAFGL